MSGSDKFILGLGSRVQRLEVKGSGLEVKGSGSASNPKS